MTIMIELTCEQEDEAAISCLKDVYYSADEKKVMKAAKTLLKYMLSVEDYRKWRKHDGFR